MSDNFNNNPRECLAHYAAKRPDSLMGYRPYVDNELTRHFIALGALEWKALDGVRYCKLTPDGQRMLEEYCHAETRAQLAAAQARIAELEAVCREVVTALELEQIEDEIRFSIPAPRELKTHYDLQGDDYEGLFDAFAHLLDILPPAE